MDDAGPPVHPDPLPDAAPLLWVVVLVAAAIWWGLPWAERWQQALRAKAAEPPPQPGALGARPERRGQGPHSAPEAEAPRPGAAKAPDVDALAVTAAAAPPPPEQHENVAPVLDFDPVEAFEATFEEAVRLVGELMLAVPAAGQEYTAAMEAVHFLRGVLDKLFTAWGSADEFARVSKLKENARIFQQHFGDTSFGGPARQLLSLAGFRSEPSGEQGRLWAFQQEDPRARLSGLTVRLCLKKLGDLQRARGAMRFTQSTNAAVLPKPGDGRLLELFDMYSEVCVPVDPPITSSMRERNVEAEVRIKLNERRVASGVKVPLTLHEGLAGAARALVHAQRRRERVAWTDPHKSVTVDVNEEVQSVLAKLPLPPGFDAAHMHWHSDELPRLFGMTSTTGRTSGEEDPDVCADILARESVGFWAARQASDVTWPSAVMCGVGAALDFTINRGFVVALLVGFDGVPLDEGATAAWREARASEIRRRRAPVEAPGTGHSKPGGFGARVYTMDNPSGVAMHAK